jgi:transcription antitermination factor NusG
VTGRSCVWEVEAVLVGSITSVGSRIGTLLPLEDVEPRWYAAYTSANHEKRVAEQLVARTVEHFLPLYHSVRRWKDRRVELDMPLFPGYVFVRIASRDRLQVLKTPGVATIVGFNGQLSALADAEIEGLKKGLVCGVRAEPHPFLNVGRRVRVKAGPLEGLEGIIIRRKNRIRLVISFDLIHRAAAVEVEAADLEEVR